MWRRLLLWLPSQLIMPILDADSCPGLHPSYTFIITYKQIFNVWHVKKIYRRHCQQLIHHVRESHHGFWPGHLG